MSDELNLNTTPELTFDPSAAQAAAAPELTLTPSAPAAPQVDEAAQAGRLIVMSHGKIVADGKPREVFQRVEELKSVGLTVPETVGLMYELRKEGLDVPLDTLSDEECAQALYRLLKS